MGKFAVQLAEFKSHRARARAFILSPRDHEIIYIIYRYVLMNIHRIYINCYDIF